MGWKTYLVLAEDGQYYGPADITVLDQWAREGRILAQTVLVEQGTNVRVLAADLPELQHHYRLWNRPGVGGQQPAGAPPQVNQPAAFPASPAGQSNPYTSSTQTPYPRSSALASHHSPVVAVLLSVFCLAGGGQMYNRQIKKGFAILAGLVASWFLIPVSPLAIVAVAAVDAYMIAARIQRGETVREWQWF